MFHYTAIEFIKFDLTDHLGSRWKTGIQINNTVYTTKEINLLFSSRMPSAIKRRLFLI